MKHLYTFLTLVIATIMASAGQSVSAQSEAAVSFTAKLTEAGTLAAVLGDRLGQIEALAIEGPVNTADFATMYEMSSTRGILTSLDLSRADVEEKMIPNGAFWMTYLDINGSEASALRAHLDETRICRLKHVVLPDDIVEIGNYAFSILTLETINLPTSLKVIGEGAFFSCQNLRKETVDIPEGVTTIGKDCFNYATGISKVILPSTLMNIGGLAFTCQSLDEISCRAIMPPACVLGDPFEGITKSAKLHVPKGCAPLYRQADYWNRFTDIIEDLEVSSLVTVRLMEAGTLAAALGERLGEIEVLAVEGPVNEEDFKTMYEMSSSRGVLSSLYLGMADVEGKKIPDKAFWRPFKDPVEGAENENYACILKHIILPDDIEEIGEFAFSIMGLESINIPAGIKTIGEAAFYGCRNLEMPTLVIPEGLTDIPLHCFGYNYKLGKVVLHDGVTSIGAGAFALSSVTEVNIPESVRHIGNAAFMQAKNLNAIVIPGSCEELYSNTFTNCYNLRDMVIGEGVKTISNDFAMNTDCLWSIELPSTLESIGPSAFESPLLGRISCAAAVPPVCGGNSFPDVPRTATLYVPEGCAALYREAAVWKEFANIVESPALSGIEGVGSDTSADERADYFNLRGERVANPAPGTVYVRRAGGEVKKVIM